MRTTDIPADKTADRMYDHIHTVLCSLAALFVYSDRLSEADRQAMHDATEMLIQLRDSIFDEVTE